MSGIDRLRALAGAWDECGLGGALADIAEQIERERDAEVADSPYDAILPEDREAIAWVREHGGIDYVKNEWRSRVPRDRYEARRQRLLGHIAECETALGRRNRRIEELVDRVSDLTNENAELRRRAIPEGMEWPRYESGEPVRIGDVVSDVEVRSVVFRDDGILLSDCTSVPGWGTWRSYKEPIKRPAVLAADGEPLEVGQTVWDANGDELVVGAIEDGGHTVTCRYADVGDGIPVHGMWSPSDLTHTKPEPVDTWQRIEEDAEKDPCSYFGFDGEEICGKCPASGKNCEQTMALDIVRRAKALAEKENRNE